MNTEKKNFLQGKLFGIIALVVMLLVPIKMNNYYQSIFILIVFYAYICCCWNICCGFLGTLSLGHSLFLGLGAYTSSVLFNQFGVSPWIGMFVGAILVCIIGVLVGFPTFRLSGPYFALTTIALQMMVMTWFSNNEWLGPLNVMGSQGIMLNSTGFSAAMFEFKNKMAYYYIAWVFLAVIILVSWLIQRSKMGYYLTAIKSDPDAAASLGINLTKYKLIAMGISCFTIALGGTYYAQYFRYINPTRIMGHDLSVRIALIALVGGQGTVLGPVFGAIIMVPLTEVLNARFGDKLPGLHLFIYGVIMILIVLFKPSGIHDMVMNFFHGIEDKIFGSKKKAESAK